MVVRKSSIPFPTSPPPPPPPPPPEVFGHQSHHQIDTADLPPIPQTATRSHANPNFEEMGNPWNDEYSPQLVQPKNVPDSLRPGQASSTTRETTSLQKLPDILRPGWSGEATPRSSLDSDRSPDKEWWDDDDFVQDEDEEESKQKEQTPLHVVNDTGVPQPSSTIKRKPLPQSPSPQSQSGNVELGSNNPYRRPSETYLEAPNNLPNWGSPSQQSQPKSSNPSREDLPNPLRSHPSTDQLGNLNLNDSSNEKIPTIPQPAAPPPPPPSQPPPPIPQLQAPLIPTRTGGNENPWVAQESLPSVRSPIPFPSSEKHQTVSTDDLLDRGQHEGSISLGDELKVLPNAAPSPGLSGPSEVSLLHDNEAPAPSRAEPSASRESPDMYAPPPGPPPTHSSPLPPVKPPRPAVVTSAHDLTRMREQRNETYQIKHFNWHDPRSSKMRRSSMLTQNKNGPCPLLALVNALILGATEDMQAALDDALRLREQVTLGLIIETLMDELLTKATMIEGLVLPDVDELNRFLMRLRTGMNANPRFVPPTAPAPNLMDADSPVVPAPPQGRGSAGTFEATQDINLYGSFSVKLVHGWLPRPGDQAAKAFARSAQTYEDAQAVQFGEEELEYKLSHGGLVQQEQQVWEDITSIKHFFQAYPTQLTPFGLEAVQSTLGPGEFAILFRNDHFSTIYKHPRTQRLYTLITDAGYADRDEIIWESLEDITGARSEFFSGDFNSVSHGGSVHPIPHSQTSAANPQRSQAAPTYDDGSQGNLTAQQQQEQHDADFAMALQLQEEEEQRMRQARSQRASQDSGGSRGGGRHQGPRRSGSGIPIPLRGNGASSNNEARPTIPPRNMQSRNPAVNRPADADAVDAPPAYEEAARTTPYNPPIGSPLHPSSSHDLFGSSSTSTSNVHAQGQTTGVTGRGNSYRDQPPGAYPGQGYGPGAGAGSRPGVLHRGTGGGRRSSAYGENTETWGQHSPDFSAGAFGPSYAFMSPGGESRRRDPTRRNDDGPCTVM